jgi:chromosome partitioning protein
VAIILTGGEKGGSAKSTTAINLASEFAFLGYKVGLLDADKKTSSKNWTIVRESYSQYLQSGEVSYPLTIEDINDIPNAVAKVIKKNGLNHIEGKHGTGDIIDTIISMNDRNDIVIIDVGGGDTEEFHMALGMCDLAIFPLKPSILDFDTVPKLTKNLSLAKARHPGLIIRSLISDAPTATLSTLVKRFKTKLMETGILADTFKTVIKNRDAYKDCLNWGLAAREWKDSSAKAEFSALAEEILQSLDNGGK